MEKSRNVGVKCSHAWKGRMSVGDDVEIEHQGILPDGGLRHPVIASKI